MADHSKLSVALAPTAEETRQLTSLFNQCRYAEGAASARTLTERFPQHAFGWKALGACLRQQGELLAAVEPMQKALALLPEDAEAHNNLGVIFRALGRLSEADANYRRALELEPDYAEAHNNLGNLLKDLGRLTEAETSYRRALAPRPDYAEAHYNLGNTLHAMGRLGEAEAHYLRTLALEPDHAEALNGLGNTLKALGRPQEAETHYRRALALDPGYAEATCNLGATLHDQGRVKEAEACFHRALELRPDYAEAHNNLGVILRALGRLAEAESSYRRALELKPGYAEAHNNLGNPLKDLGRLAEAETSYRRALALKPDYAEAHYNLGNTLNAMGRLEEAETHYLRALALQPDHAEALNGLGNTLKALGRPQEAEASYRRALALDPGYAEATCNLGATLHDQGRLDEAETCFRRALKFRPDYAEAHNNLGMILSTQGRFQKAEASFRRALEIRPDYADARSNLLFALNYSAGHDASRDLEEAREYGRRLDRTVRARFSSWQCASRPARLTVGLVSGDLRHHVVGYFLEGVLARIDPARMTLIAYPTAPQEDEMTARLRPHFARWQPLFGRSDEAAANLIHADGVHVLLDLSGHTAHNRLAVFAWKPAPVQASWLGYFATTGVAQMDYLIADAVGVPETDRAQFTETIWYLPDTRLCFTAPEVALPVAPLPALAKGHITFGCFQNLTKVGDEVLAAWAKIVAALPAARLRLQCTQLGDPAMVKRLVQRLRQHGIDPAQVAMHGIVHREAYLAAHSEVDLILDTFPYPGGTTTCEALWMGVPTLTLAGNRLLSRQGASLLSAAGLPEWVAASKTDYADKALAVARDLPKLAALRAGLREQVLASALFDAPRFACHFEQALWGMWQRWQDHNTLAATQVAEQVKSEQQQTASEWLPASSEASQEGKLRSKTRPTMSDKSATNSVSSNARNPSPQEITALVTLFNRGRYAEAVTLAQRMTEHFPHHEIGWKALGTVLKQMGQSADALAPLQRATALSPDDADTHNNLGVTLRDLGRPDEAEASYRRALQIRPDYVEAHSNLGNTLRDLGRLNEAEASHRRALQIKPDYAEAHSNLGNTLRELSRLDEAEASCRKALQIKPAFAEAHSNLGAILRDLGRPDEAEASCRRALQIKPDYAEAHNNLGNALRDLGQLDDAVASFHRSLEIRPYYAEAHVNLGNTLRDKGRLDEAQVSYRHALQIKPDYAEAHSNLGNALRDLSRLDEAEASYRRGLQIKPEYAEAHSNLGNTLRELARLDEAEVCCRHALQIKPDYAEAHNNLGATLRDLGRLDEAEASYRRALEINADYAEAHRNLSIALLDLGRLSEVEASCRRALEIRPDYADARSNLLFALNYSAGHDASRDLEEAREYGRRLDRTVRARFSSWQCASRPARLTVGLVSGDLRHHVVGYFLEGVLARIDPARMTLIAYPTAPQEDEMTARLRPHFARWQPLFGRSDEAAANLIHADGVHVLLDLSGHTAHNRLAVFAWKPAPVQASWLGYFATTGVAQMDYLIADAVGVPETDRAQFTETIWYLPDTRLCFTAPEVALPVAPLPALAKGHITFGCFQNLTKVGDEVLAAWAKIVAALPAARLRLQCTQLGDPAMVKRLVQRLRQHGIDPAQVAMHGIVHREAYLAAHSEVDLILDTFPYPGGTTTCEALWMGVPTLTLAGNRLLSRQGASLLSAAGLPEWVAASKTDYADKALAVARDLPKLAALRAGLREQVLASALFDAPRFACHFEQALWGMWQRWQDHNTRTPSLQE